MRMGCPLLHAAQSASLLTAALGGALSQIHILQALKYNIQPFQYDLLEIPPGPISIWGPLDFLLRY